MGSALVYVIVVGLVAAAVYLLAAFVFGRGEELAPMPPGATPTRLPARDLTGGDVRDLRFQQALRGYKCSEVDWALERLAAEIDALRARVDAVEGADAAEGAGHGEPARTNGHAAAAGPDAARPEPARPEPARPDAADPAPTDPTGHQSTSPTAARGASPGALRGTPGPDGPR